MTGREAFPNDERRLQDLLGLAASSVSPAPAEAVAAVAVARRRAHRRRAVRLSGVLTAVAVAAAATGVAVSSGAPAGGRTVRAPSFALTGALHSFGGCSAYLRYVRSRAERLVGPYGLSGPDFSSPLDSNSLRFPPNAAAGFRAPLPYGNVDQHSAGSAAAPVTHSGTTDQVAGVDEPDTVKTDGHVVVTLTGPSLRVLDTGARVLGTLQLPGDTSGGMLLDGHRIVVLSATAQSQPGVEAAGPWPGMRTSTPFSAPVAAPARAAIVDISDPRRPRLLRTFVFSGSLMGVRSVNGEVRLVVGASAPRITFQTPQTAGNARTATRENRRLVRHSGLAQWLPRWQIKSPDGSSTAWRPLSSCSDIARPLNPIGLTTISVFSLSPGATAPSAAATSVAAGNVVYATPNHVYLAGVTSGQMSDGPRTRIYDFDTAQQRPVFLGAGWVPGALLNSYAMDESGGYLRVASTVTGSRGRPHSRISVLRLSGRVLAHVGSIGGVGRNEQIRAVRFIGDLAFVVTYRSFDPMYVIDLRDATRPRVVGRLRQPGFSEFLYPLSAERLVGVGVEIRRNEPAALLVSTYDVSDPSAPRRLAATPLARGYAAGAGGYDPHAFLSWPADHLVVVALPADPGYGPAGRRRGAVAYRVGGDGSLTALVTLAHGGVAPTRTLVVGGRLWAVTGTGVITASLGNLRGSTVWRPY